jgi:hypothetical protein
MHGTTQTPRRRTSTSALSAAALAVATVAPLALSALPAHAGVPGAAGTVTRASVSTGGTQARGSSTPPVRAGMSLDGTRVAFTSTAANLVPRDTNKAEDAFVRDLRTGRTVRASVNNRGVQANDGIGGTALSADGRHVTFETFATNLGGGRDQRVDVFLRDLDRRTTRRVSVARPGRTVNGDSFSASPSGNGRFVAFQSTASNLVKGDRNGMEDVFVRDLRTGRTRLISRTPAGRQFRTASIEPSISANGRSVLFATLTVADEGFTDLYVWDRRTGTTRRVYRELGGGQHSIASSWRLSANGRYLALMSDAPLTADDVDGEFDAYRISVGSGAVVRASLTSDNRSGRGVTGRVGISGDGTHVAFSTEAPGYLPTDQNRLADVFVRDLVAATTTQVSVGPTGSGANGHSGFQGYLALDRRGTEVSFESGATDLVTGDTNDAPDVFVWRAR